MLQSLRPHGSDSSSVEQPHTRGRWHYNGVSEHHRCPPNKRTIGAEPPNYCTGGTAPGGGESPNQADSRNPAAGFPLPLPTAAGELCYTGTRTLFK